MVVLCPAPIMLTESSRDNAPKLPVQSLATLAIVSVYVPAGTMTVSVPASALALRMASRRLQSLATPLHALVIGATGTGSSVRLTVNVGSGMGITMVGAMSP